MISIITVNYNDSSRLKATVESVIGQLNADYEFIVIDGASKDDSVNILNSYPDKINYWISEPDRGIFDAMNKGAAKASGEYCLFMNSGDIFASKTILSEVAPLLDADIVCGNAQLTNGQNRVWVAPDVISDRFWRQRCSLCHQAVFIKTEILKRNPYDASLKIVGDYKFLYYVTSILGCTYKHIDKIICQYGCDGISSNDALSDSEKIKVIDEFVRMGYIREDALVSKAKKMKVGSKRYVLASLILSILS